MLHVFFCFFKQKTAYDMRISDWSSDVCSSDLSRRRRHIMFARQIAEREQQRHPPAPLAQRTHDIVASRRRRDVRQRRVGAVSEEARHIVGVEYGETWEAGRVGCETGKRRLAAGSLGREEEHKCGIQYLMSK